jgi:hypothetical protein
MRDWSSGFSRSFPRLKAELQPIAARLTMHWWIAKVQTIDGYYVGLSAHCDSTETRMNAAFRAGHQLIQLTN